MSAVLHPIFQQALAPFAPPPLRWFRVRGSNAAGRVFIKYGQYVDGFQAIEKNAEPGLFGLAAHPMTDEEVREHRALMDEVVRDDARTFDEPRALRDFSEPRGEYDSFTQNVRGRAA